MSKPTMRSLLSAVLIAMCVSVLTGCAAAVHENHYFAAFKDGAPNVREPVQFYRLAVDGNAYFSNARYLSGYFDERAISLFFNEMRGSASAKLFEDNQTLPGTDGTKLTPLSPTGTDGAFVLVMSSNADSIVNAIGSFAESQVVADALTRVLNKERFQSKLQSDAKLPVLKAEATALVARLDADAGAATGALTGGLARASYLRVLTTLAQSLGYTGQQFASLSDAQAWYTLEDARTGGVK